MVKKVGAIFVLSLLVLSVGFVSANWFSDVFSITGNVVHSNGFDTKSEYCPGVVNQKCSYLSKSGKTSSTATQKCQTYDYVLKDLFSKTAERNKFYDDVYLVKVLEVGCRNYEASTKKSYKVSCPIEGYDLCVKNDNDGKGNSVILGVKLNSLKKLECTSFTYNDWSSCINGQQTRTVKTSSPSNCIGGTPVLSQSCIVEVPKPPVLLTINGSCGNGVDSCESGVFEDADDINTHYRWKCLGLNGGSDAKCESPKSSSTCADSDGGLNYYVKGSVTDAKFSELTDFCISPDEFNQFTPTVIEYYCDYFPAHENWSAGYYGTTKQVACPNGCLDGACINNSVPEGPKCYDSDGGLNYYEKGYITDKYSGEFPNGQISDSCEVISNWSNGNTDFVFSCNGENCYVRDYYCVGNDNHNSDSFKCLNGCYDGACIKYFTPKTCDDVLSIFKNSSDIYVINDRDYLEEWESYGGRTYEGENGVEILYSDWKYKSGYEGEYLYAYGRIESFEDINSARNLFSDLVENGICRVQEVYFDSKPESPFEKVYVCRDIWEIGFGQRNLDGKNVFDSEKRDIFWINGKNIINFRFDSYYYDYCYDSESCARKEIRDQMNQQDSIVGFLNKVIDNNQMSSVNLYLSTQMENFLVYFLKGCKSQGISSREVRANWICKQEPVICPPHGEQKQICIRYNSETDKEEKREVAIQCNPGICAGCYVPRWFGGSATDTKCLPYGARFEQETGKFKIIEEIFSGVIKGREEGHSSRITVKEVEMYGGDEISMKVYPDNSMDFRMIDWGNKTFRLVEKSQLNLLDLYDNVNVYTLEEWFTVDKIYYDSENYEESYFDFTVYTKTSDRYYEYSNSREVPDNLNMYCDYDGRIKEQKISEFSGSWARCQNNFECSSNLCSNGECVDTKAIAEEIKGFKGFLVRMLCRLSNPFSDNGYTQCLLDNN